MKELKKALILLLILVIIIFAIIIILNKNWNKEEVVDPIVKGEPDTSQDAIKEMGLVNDYSIFFSVEKMINNYIVDIEFGKKESIYSLLDKDYIGANNITQDNVLTKVTNIIKYTSNLTIREMYGQEDIKNAVYYVKCISRQQQQWKEFYILLVIDRINETYSISHIDKETYEKEIKIVNKELAQKTIEKNEYNETVFVEPTEQEIAEKYFKSYIENALYYPEYAYSSLNEQYKNKRFTDLQDFKQFVEEKRDLYTANETKKSSDFSDMTEYMMYMANKKHFRLEGYQIRNEAEYDRYICEISNGDYYIFYAETPFNYTLVLDNYTVPTTEFVNEYNTSSDTEKIVLNIKRFFMAIDDQNYGYVYSVLSKSFKNNKYPNRNDFINYAKQNFFEENDIEYISYEKQNNVYVYKIKITDATGQRLEERTLNMIVKLNSGTEFEMSFGEE